MGDINSFIGVVRILENPKKFQNSKEILVTKFRVQFPQVRKNQYSIIHAIIWGKLSDDVLPYYRINDYVLIEGTLSFKNENKKTLDYSNKERKKIYVTVLKIYPFKLNSIKVLASTS